MTDRPTLRLRPKANARNIRHGFPWVYADDLVLDRRSKALPAGTLARLEDSDRKPLGLVAATVGSRIAARMLDRDSDAQIDGDWMETRISRALGHRDRLYSDPFYRLIHAEADGMPGLIIDRFGDAAVIQPNAAWAEIHFEMLAQTVVRVCGVSTIYKNASGRMRAAEGLDDASCFWTGGQDGPVEVPMNGATYLADISGGQKTGLFFDQRPNHAFAAGLSEGARVLDVFSHVGGFALAALAGRATSALAVDGSQAALTLAETGARKMGAQDRFSIRKGDAFDVLAELGEAGERFDVVICDPPAFAPSKKALEAGLRAYERIARLAAPLVTPGGYLGLCSCSHAAELPKFRASSIRGIGRAGRQSQLIHTGFAGPDHPVHPQLAESGYLKALFFRIL